MNKKEKKELKLKPQLRHFELRNIDTENRTVELSFSSEEPYERGWGIEILGHAPGECDLSRLNNSANVLFNHDWDIPIGVSEWAKIENRRGVALARFGNSAKAEEYWTDIKSGILKNVSIGYIVDEMILISETDGVGTYRVTKWMPYEISIVTVPADTTVGVGRGAEMGAERAVTIWVDTSVVVQEDDEEDNQDEINQTQEEKTMEKPIDEVAVKTAERERIANIRAIGLKHGFIDEAQKAIDSDESAEAFGKRVLDAIGERSNNPISGVSHGAEVKEQEFNLGNLVRALANPTDAKLQALAKKELDSSRDMAAKMGIEPNGVLIPASAIMRTLSVTSLAGAGVATTTGSPVAMYANQSSVLPYADILPGLVGNFKYFKQTAHSTAYQVDETGTINESDIDGEDTELTPKRFGASSSYSKQLLIQSPEIIENILKNDLITQISLKIDAYVLNKILTTAGVGLVECGENGGAITNGKVIDMESEIFAGNAGVDGMAYIANARTRGKLKQTPITANNPKMVCEGNEMNGYPVVVSNQLPNNGTKGTHVATDLNTMVFGNFKDLYVGFWGVLDMIVDPYTLAGEGKIKITLDQFADADVKRTASFSVSKDIDLGA